MIFLTGSSGFIGNSLIEYFGKKNIIKSDRGGEIIIAPAKIVIHVAGKAHDLKNDNSLKDYISVNTELTKQVFNEFLKSDAKVFITLSSVKAVTDFVEGELLETFSPNPISNYGKSKLYAENHILSCKIPDGKSFYILRPCMIHGPKNKGNLNLLYGLVSKGFPWPLGAFENSRSYLSIENLCFIIKELIEREDIPSGIYNVADDVPVSTNEIIKMIAESRGRKARILNLSKNLIKLLARVGDILKLPLNSERLQKLTESYVVSNAKIKAAIGKPLPVRAKEGLMKTFQSFCENA